MKTVLIVEDEPHLRLLYEIEMNREGYKILTAADGEDCLEYLEAMPVDLVVLDIRMPGRDGIEVLQGILARWRSIPVILHSAYRGYRENYLTWGARAFLVKSSDLGKLKRTIKEILGPVSGDARRWTRRTPATLKQQERIEHAGHTA